MEGEAKDNKKTPLPSRMMPRDVATRWNSTYEMLVFAYSYREALDKITANREMNLRACELSGDEWKIVAQLRDVLKVCSFHIHFFKTLS